MLLLDVLVLRLREFVDEPSSGRRGVSNRLTLLVRFGESRPQPSCCRFAASDVEGCLKNFLSSGPNLPEASPCEAWAIRRTRPASCTPMKARNGRLKRRWDLVFYVR